MTKTINLPTPGARAARSRNRFAAVVASATLALATLTAGSAEAATWNVPGDFATIQAAIDDAGVVNGDTINVAAGVYGEFSAPVNDAIQVTKELSIIGAGSGDGTGSELRPGAGAEANNAVVRILASNVTLRGFRVDAKSGLDAVTQQIYTHGVYSIGTSGDISNVTIDDVFVLGAGKGFEVNNVNGLNLTGSGCDTSVSDYKNTKTQCFRLVDSDNVAISNSTAGNGPGHAYNMVGFQGAVSASLDNVTMTSDGTQAYSQYIFAQPVGYCCDPGTQQYTYGNVTMEGSDIGIFISDNPGSYTTADFAVTLTQNAGTSITFTNINIPMQRSGLGEVIGLNDFVCANSIPHRVTIGTQESYFLSNADAVAYQTANGGTVDAVVCAVCGDGVVESGEQCDDSNTDAGDCCSATCQYEAAGSTCGSQSDTDCDNPNTCDATGTCLDNFEPITTECRPVNGVCDVADFCDGSGSCDPDAFVSAGTECRANDGDVNSRGFICDPAESCTGTGADCPADVVSGSNIVCNGGSGNANGGSVCDPADYCTGVAGESCPANTNLEPLGTVCRAALGECDFEELCSGIAEAECGTDQVIANGTACYTDPVIADSGGATPDPANPCPSGDCQCSDGLCVTASATASINLEAGTVKLRTAKAPNKPNGKAAIRGAKLKDIIYPETDNAAFAAILNEMTQPAPAISLQLLIEDVAGAAPDTAEFRALRSFDRCDLRRSQKRDKWKCYPAGGQGTMTITTNYDTVESDYTIGATLKKQPQSETGDGGLGLGVKVTIFTDQFYQAAPQGALGASECETKGDNNEQLLCGVGYPGPFVGRK